MRLFIAINFTNKMQDALVKCQNDLRAAGITGNYTAKENLHLTLAFIGEYPDPEAVLDVMDTVDFTPFDLRLSGAGAFHDLFWVGTEPSDALNAYVKRLRRALSESQIPFDRKKFSPHITLIRKARKTGHRPLGEGDIKGKRSSLPNPHRPLGSGDFREKRSSLPKQPHPLGQEDMQELFRTVKFPNAGMTVERISLMRSDRGKQGMIYTEIGTTDCTASSKQ